MIFDNAIQQTQIENPLKSYTNMVRLLPLPDLDKSIKILQECGQHLQGTNAQGFDWSTLFVKHCANWQLAKYEVFAEGKTPTQTCA